MNPRCAWTQWRLSAMHEGYKPSRRARRHANRCPRCASFCDGLSAWVEALRTGARDRTPLAPDVQDRILRAVREADIAPSEPVRLSRPVPYFRIPRLAAAAVALALALAIVSAPVATRVRRTRAVRHLTRRSAEWAHVMTHVPGSIELPLAMENDRFAQDITRAFQFLADGLPLLGALESAVLDESLLR